MKNLYLGPSLLLCPKGKVENKKELKYRKNDFIFPHSKHSFNIFRWILVYNLDIVLNIIILFVLSVYYHSHFIFRILFTFLYAVGEYKSRHKKEGPIFTLRKASRWASCVKEYSKDLLVSSSHRWGRGPLDHWVKLVCCVVYIGPGPNELMGLILSGRPAVTEDALQRWALRSPEKEERYLWGGKLDCEEMEYRKLKDLVFIFRIFENV